ncbi:MAG TPA: hypothetical protein VGQ53_07865 [Chitinophagaceae bacterium]|jgi:hypothetical protein|nr:hypothetical protein [Chitinophagaceae bacterium]
MKCKTIVTIAAMCFLAVGCKSKLAKDYNDMIVNKQKNLGKSMDQAAPLLKSYFASYEYDSIASVSSRMEIKIDTIIKEIAKKPVPDVKQGENFKKAALHYFDYMKSIYTSYKNYALQNSPEGRQIQLQIMSMIINNEDKMIAEMQKAQQIFAKDNGFKIRSSKPNSSIALE